MEQMTQAQALAMLRSLIDSANARAKAGDIQGLADLVTIRRLVLEEIDRHGDASPGVGG